MTQRHTEQAEGRPLRNDRPILFLDVDGVLNCIMAETGQTTHVELEFPWSLALPLGADLRLRRLAEEFEIVWATAWRESAAALIGPALGVEGGAVLSWGQMKLPAILQHARGRRWAWVDDDAQWELDEQPELAGEIEGNLVLSVAEDRGLDSASCEALLEFARG